MIPAHATVMSGTSCFLSAKERSGFRASPIIGLSSTAVSLPRVHLRMPGGLLLLPVHRPHIAMICAVFSMGWRKPVPSLGLIWNPHVSRGSTTIVSVPLSESYLVFFGQRMVQRFAWPFLGIFWGSTVTISALSVGQVLLCRRIRSEGHPCLGYHSRGDSLPFISLPNGMGSCISISTGAFLFP